MRQPVANQKTSQASSSSSSCRAGCAQLILNREELNRINVFPIPDGDTGTNMGMACQGIMRRLDKLTPATSLGLAAAEVAQACLVSAQGNSGTILTFFFSSLAGQVAGRTAISPVELASVLEATGQAMMGSMHGAKRGTLENKGIIRAAGPHTAPT